MSENFNEDMEHSVPENTDMTPVEPIQVMDRKPKRNNKSKTILKVASVIVLGFGSGYAGGYIQDTISPKATIVEQAPSETITVSSNTGQMTLQEVIAKEKNTVVEILSTVEYNGGFFNQSITSESAGSGVIISEDGYIVTNYHVIEDSKDIQITLADGSAKAAEIVATDSKSDLAVLKIDGSGYDYAVFGDSDSLVVGDTAIAIGNPLGSLGGSVTTGIISALDREITVGNETMTLLQTNAEINPGNSGGGLFNDQGLLMGIVNAKSSATDVEGIGFAIPSNEVKDIVTQLINDGYVSDRATLGVYVTEITQDTQLYPAGLYITDFLDDSAAEKAGLEVYDQITKIDNTEISSYNDLSTALKDYKAGDTVTIEVVRRNETIDVQVTLSQALPQDTEEE